MAKSGDGAMLLFRGVYKVAAARLCFFIFSGTPPVCPDKVVVRLLSSPGLALS